MRSLFYTSASEMAIRAALFLALQPPGKLSTIHDIAHSTGLPQPYLAKIIRRLTCAGLVRAFRGPGGGIELGRAPQAISLGGIVRTVEGPRRPDWCVLGVHGCSEQNPCPLHQRWAPLRAEMNRLLEETTLDTLTHALREATEQGEASWLHFRGDVGRRPSEPSEGQKAP